MSPYAENTDTLDQYLQDVDDDDDNDLPTAQADALQFHDTALPILRDERSRKRKQSPQVFDEIVVQRRRFEEITTFFFGTTYIRTRSIYPLNNDENRLLLILY